jgi:hypothetical protein
MSRVDDFRRLPPAKRYALVAVGTVQVGLSVAAEIDIHRRPAERIRGGKLAWRLACLTNTVGPVSYFAWGRRKPAPS